jgi:hypothetical protein
MLYPIVLDPAFLNQIKDNENYRKKIQDFIKEYKTFLSDFFILVDDNKKSLDKEYDKIIKEGEQNILGSIIASEFKKLKRSGKSISIKTSNNSFPVKNILDTLKNNNINKIVEFPKFFEENFINVKKNVSKQHIVNMKYNEFMNKIVSITRFSKKIYFIDPMIPYDLLPLNCENYNVKRGKISILNATSYDKQRSSDRKAMGTINYYKKKGEMYSFSLNKIIEKIYQNNFFKDDLKITIYTTINTSKIKKLMGSIETDEEKNIWFDLHNILSECIKKQTKYPIQVIVKKHIKYNDNKKEDVYDRAIYAVDIDSGLEVRKGLDILDPESSNNLRNEANYYLRMCISDEEKDMILGILNHDPYKPPMHFRKKN